MTVTIKVRIAKGIKNKNSGTRMTWWKTNFNMPVPNLFDDQSNWVRGYGPFDYLDEATSFDFTGFVYGWEAIIGCSIVDFENEPEQNIQIEQVWIDNKYQFTNNYYGKMSDTTDGSWREGMAISNQGIASWEINDSFNGTNYRLRTRIYNTDTGDLLAEDTTNIGIDNVPTDPGELSQKGYLRVDGELLKYINANGREHTITGISDGQENAQPGFIWIEDNNLKYTSKQGYKRHIEVKIKQFKSIFSNGAPGEVSGQDPGYLYADNEFGWTHLSIIGKDGYKRLICSGHNTQTDPY